MTDLLDRLSVLDAAGPVPAADVVAADLARGRTALVRRRRARGAAAGVGLTLSLGAGLGVVVLAGHDADAPMADPSPGSPSISAGRGDHSRIALVDYDGQQPVGFEIAQVPEGYVVQGSDATVLTLARPDDHSSYLSFEDKVVVTLESVDAVGEPRGRAVEVDGAPGVISSSPDSLSRTLFYDDGAYTVEIQAWRTVGLTDDQLVRLAEGITITDAVVAPVG